MRLEVDPSGRERLHPVVRETDGLTVAEEREVARLKQRLTVFVETFGRPMLLLPPLLAWADRKLMPLCREDSLMA